MITITSGATNSIVLRLNDNKTINNPIYLFELTSVQSREKFYFTAYDYSQTTRFNEFKVFETTGTALPNSLTASTPYIRLSYGGSYLYKVYQKTNYTLNTNGGVLLDNGLLIFRNGEYQSFFFITNDETIIPFDEWSEIWSFSDNQPEIVSILSNVDVASEFTYLDTDIKSSFIDDILEIPKALNLDDNDIGVFSDLNEVGGTFNISDGVSKVFVEWSEPEEFNIGDDDMFGIFDPEFIVEDFYLLQEDDFYILQEDDSKIIIS